MEDEKIRMEALRVTGGELIEDENGVSGVRVHGWDVRSSKRPILNSEERDKLEARLGTRHLPEMVFGYNSLELIHHSSRMCICFNALDALQGWKQESLAPIEIPAAAKWKYRSDLNDQEKLDYDYTFTTPYSGSQSVVSNSQNANTKTLEWVACEDRIDFEILQARDPILFYDEVILYEDELADNGISFLSVKVRVMPSCWFLLLRFWLRVDGVLMRLRDTRMFCSFLEELPVVIRDVCHREETFESLVKNGTPLESINFRDPNLMADMLAVKCQRYEKLSWKSGT